MQAAFAGVEHGSRVLATAEQQSSQRALEEPLRKRIEAASLLLEGELRRAAAPSSPHELKRV